MITGTQNDLSFNLAKLDYQAMLHTAQIACRATKMEIERLLHDTYDLGASASKLRHTGNRLAEAAQQFAHATDTLWALDGCKEREELEVVNRPEVKEDE